MPTFQRGDLRLWYGERGRSDGRPFVVTHGLLWSSRMMERAAGLLPDERVILLDLHGHGRSDKPSDPARYTWAELAADVVGLLDHLGIDSSAPTTAMGITGTPARMAISTKPPRPKRRSW